MKNKHKIVVSIGNDAYKEIEFMSKATNRSIEHCASQMFDIAYNKMDWTPEQAAFQLVTMEADNEYNNSLSIRKSRNQKRSQLLLKKNDKI